MSDIKHWRTAGGAAHKEKGESILRLPFKDVGASVPGIDISAGLMQENDSPKSLQLGEAVEELTYADPKTLDTKGPATIYTADIIENTSIEERFRHFYERAAELSDGKIPEDYEIEFVDSERTSLNEDVMDSTEQYGDKVFGAVHEPPADEDDKWSRELTEYLEINVPEGAVPIDLEMVEEGDESFWLNRIDFEINVETGNTKVWREGEILYESKFDEALEYVNDQVDDWGYNLENKDKDQKNPYETPFNVKSAAAVQGMDAEVHESIDKYLE